MLPRRCTELLLSITETYLPTYLRPHGRRWTKAVLCLHNTGTSYVCLWYIIVYKFYYYHYYYYLIFIFFVRKNRYFKRPYNTAILNLRPAGGMRPSNGPYVARTEYIFKCYTIYPVYKFIFSFFFFDFRSINFDLQPA